MITIKKDPDDAELMKNGKRKILFNQAYEMLPNNSILKKVVHAYLEETNESKIAKKLSLTKKQVVAYHQKAIKKIHSMMEKIERGEIVMEKGKCILCVALNKIAGITDESKAEDAYYSTGFGKGNCYNKYNKLKARANKIGIKIGPKDYVDLAVLFTEKLGDKRSYMNKEALIELRGLINEADVPPEVWKYLQSLSSTKSKTAGLTKQKNALVPVQIATTGDGKIITINLTLNIHLHKE